VNDAFFAWIAGVLLGLLFGFLFGRLTAKQNG